MMHSGTFRPGGMVTVDFRGFGVFVLLAFGMAAVLPGASAQAEVKILKYDKSGRGGDVIRSDKKKKRDSTSTKKSAPKSSKRKGRTFDPDEAYEEGEVIVLNPPKNFASGAGQLGFSISERVTLDSFGVSLFRLKTPAGKSVRESIRILKSRFPGLNIDANHTFDSSAGPKAGSRSSIRDIVGWQKIPLTCGKKVVIGMIDSPVDVKHPALKGQRVVFRSFHKKGRRKGPADHGTAVAAMLVGKPGKGGWGGLLPAAKLYAGNMFEYNEGGRLVGNAVALLKSLNWLAKKKVHVINLSVAGADNKALRTVFGKARKKNLVMVAAAGNWGKGAKPAFPAAYKHVVAVTAYGRNKRVYRMANDGNYIDFAAPGVRMWTAVPGGGKFQSGTSFATPYLSVMMALEIVNGGGKGASALRGALKKKAVDLGKPGKDSIFGWGDIAKKPKC